MELIIFILIIGIVLTSISLAIKFFGQLTPKDPNCSQDVKSAKQTRNSQIILYYLGITIISISLLLLFLKQL